MTLANSDDGLNPSSIVMKTTRSRVFTLEITSTSRGRNGGCVVGLEESDGNVVDGAVGSARTCWLQRASSSAMGSAARNLNDFTDESREQSIRRM